MNSPLKNAFKKLPGIRRILAQRNQLLSERDRLLSDLVALRRGWDELRSELIATRRDLHDVNSTLPIFESQLKALQTELAGTRKEVDSELMAARSETTELQQKLATLQERWDALYLQLLALQSDSDATHSHLTAATRSRDELQEELRLLKRNLPGAPPGHFYSPIPALDEVRKLEDKIFGSIPRDVAGFDMHEAEQLELLRQFLPYYREMPFPAQQQDGMRYYFENPSYSYSDGSLLHCMIRHLKPRRIVEVGSGFSSCMMLDTNDRCFDGSIAITFIEPYPELLMSVVKEADRPLLRIIESRLQDVELEEFQVLQANDILFVDSTHVSKIGSDVNRIFFDILPCLNPGVHVHFHDIFFPFEYPKIWVCEGRAWNEAYLLRVFLQYNSAFRVVLMNTFLQRFNQPFFEEHMPLCLKNTGASVWIRRD